MNILKSTNANQKSVDYRGALFYSQEHGYKLITLMIDLRTPNEQSSVLSSLCDLDIIEEAEHIPANLPLVAIDIYHFSAIDGTEIELTIKCQSEEHTARYVIDATGVQEHSCVIWLDIVKSSQSRQSQNIID